MPEAQKTAEIKIRVTPKVKNRLILLADMYAAGNLSAWMEYGGLNAPRSLKMLEKKLLPELRSGRGVKSPKGAER